MTIRELEKKVIDLGLSCEWSNNFYVVMQIWQPYNDNGFQLNNKYYSAEVLGKKEVTLLNAKFFKLLSLLKQENIKIKAFDVIENGVISQISVLVRSETLLSNEKKTLNFKVETFEGVNGNKSFVDYNDVIPKTIGYGADNHQFTTTNMFKNIKLKKHELDLVIENIDEIFVKVSKTDNLSWIMNFISSQNDERPLLISLERNIITPKEALEYFFEYGNIYYNKESKYTKIFLVLSEYKVDNVIIEKNSSRGCLPIDIVENNKLYRKILENWEFEYSTGQRILEELIQNDQFKQFKQFVNTKDPKKYYFDDWYELDYYVLKTVARDDLKFAQKLFDDKWLELEDIDNEYLFEFFKQQLTTNIVSNEPLLVNEYLKVKSIEEIDELLDCILNISKDEKINIPMVIQPFINNSDDLNFMVGDGEIMKYIKEGDSLYKKLIHDDTFVDYLVRLGKFEYMPATVKDIFLF